MSFPQWGQKIFGKQLDGWLGSPVEARDRAATLLSAIREMLAKLMGKTSTVSRRLEIGPVVVDVRP
jgi:hypothetical protein